jgi:hypothetical protein
MRTFATPIERSRGRGSGLGPRLASPCRRSASARQAVHAARLIPRAAPRAVAIVTLGKGSVATTRCQRGGSPRRGPSHGRPTSRARGGDRVRRRAHRRRGARAGAAGVRRGSRRHRQDATAGRGQSARGASGLLAPRRAGRRARTRVPLRRRAPAVRVAPRRRRGARAGVRGRGRLGARDLRAGRRARRPSASGRSVVRDAARPLLADGQSQRGRPAARRRRRPALVRPPVAALPRPPRAPARGPAGARRAACAPSPAWTPRCSARSPATR